jgi:hypothetical protein
MFFSLANYTTLPCFQNNVHQKVKKNAAEAAFSHFAW